MRFENLKFSLLGIQHVILFFSAQLSAEAFFKFYKKYLELLHTGHVVAEHAVLQHGDGVALASDLLDLLTCAVAERGEICAGML